MKKILYIIVIISLIFNIISSIILFQLHQDIKDLKGRITLNEVLIEKMMKEDNTLQMQIDYLESKLRELKENLLLGIRTYP